MKANDAAMCPVMKSPISKEVAKQKGLVREYNGKKYYLCCVACGSRFDKNPAQYTDKDESTA